MGGYGNGTVLGFGTLWIVGALVAALAGAILAWVYNAVSAAQTEELFWYVTNSKSSSQFGNPPGYAPVSANVKYLRSGFSGPELCRQSLDFLMDTAS